VVPDPVAWVTQIFVGRVVVRLYTAVGEGAAQITRRECQKWPEESIAARRDSGQPLPTRSEEDSQQHRLDLVVAMMRGDDPMRPFAIRDLPQKFVAHASRRPLETLTGAP